MFFRDLSITWKQNQRIISHVGNDFYRQPQWEEVLDLLLACKEAYEDPCLMDLLRAISHASIGEQIMEKDLQQKILVGEYYAYLEVLSARGITTEALSEDELKKLTLPDLRTLVQRTRDLARTPSRG
jgi:hypothetical protein